MDTRMDQIQFPLLEQRRGRSELRRNKPDTLAIQVHDENKLSHQHDLHSEGNNTDGGRPVMRNGCCEETKSGRNKQARLFLITGGFFNECYLDATVLRIREDMEGTARAQYKSLPGFCLWVLG
jgi:hypothetical protein